jgi:hypothetical protein
LLPEARLLPDSASIWARSAVSPSEDLLRRLAEEEAEEEVEEDSPLDMKSDAEKQESPDIPPREDLRKREKAKKKKK